MKRNLSQSRHPAMKTLGIVLLAASLVAGPGLVSVASAVEPAPTPTLSSSDGSTGATAAPAPTGARAPSTPQTAPAEPRPVEKATGEPQPVATSPGTSQSMAEAVGVGGAEMGQRSARVTASAPSESLRRLSTESLSSEGTWMPTFGIQGLDVSGHQPSVDWQQQWNMGARFAYVKATEGNYYTNPSYGSQYQGARNVGMIRGAYHFAIPNWSSGADQARYFVQNGGGWSGDGYTMPPVLDFEFNPYEGRTINGFYFGNTCYNMSPAQLQTWVRDFGHTVQSLTGRLPVIYTNTSWWNQCLGNPAGFGDYPLWIAAYPDAPTNNAGPVPTASWGTYSIWQYSSTGPFAGDSNVWNGDYAGLKAFATSGVPPAAVKAIDAFRASMPSLGAPTSTIICGLRDGGCFRGYEAGIVMWSPTAGAQPSLAGPIRDAWARKGYENGQMGYPVSGVICGLKNGGCFQNYQGGSIMWSPSTGAALVPFGAIREHWAAQGYENGGLGYPLSDQVCGLKSGGCFQLFQAGSVLWSPATGARLVKPGPVMEAWGRAGYENGLLGYPNAEANCTSSFCTQNFSGGVVAWTPTSGAWPVFMGMGETWKASRTKGEPIGFPVAGEVCGLRGGGCYQLFQGGALLFSPATGAHTLTGRILDYWQKSGFENGRLGYPAGPASCGAVQAECRQAFEKGVVGYSAATAPETVAAGPMAAGWERLGWGAGSLGYPTSGQYCGLKDGGCFQMFAKGALMYSPATGAQPSLLGPIRDLWQKTGFENGSLGYPASDVICGLVDGGCFQNYSSGTVMWSAGSGANAVMFGPVRDAWVSTGFEGGKLGYPVSGQICGLRNNGCFQNFAKGTVMYSPATGAQALTSTPIRERWGASGYESGSLGYPTSGTICGLRNDGCFQNFEKGTVMWSSASGAHLIVPGPIQQSWAGQGFEAGALGYPTSSQTCTADRSSCSQTFQGGSITWTTAGGARITLR
ncbi:GH25 family lysozyme, partial [Arthrobacter sp. Cr_A7]|uniref:GH25 family lysozyme n=1 Tax=Arthrobacter sp. Cr_A7 TaxID=3031017 RepID=UPI0023D9BA80